MAELLLNGVRVFLTATPATLRKPAEISFKINSEELPELRHLTIFVRVGKPGLAQLPPLLTQPAGLQNSMRIPLPHLPYFLI